MPEAVALQVVERDLAYELRPQWLPGQVLAAVPAGGGAGHALPLGGGLPFLPLTPGMAGQGIDAVGLEEGHQLAALDLGER